MTFNEPQFQGHFPGHPVMPGVMVIEAMAQAAGVLTQLSREGSAHEREWQHLCQRGDALGIQ